jgi:hypothetical protein
MAFPLVSGGRFLLNQVIPTLHSSAIKIILPGIVMRDRLEPPRLRPFRGIARVRFLELHRGLVGQAGVPRQKSSPIRERGGIPC